MQANVKVLVVKFEHISIIPKRIYSITEEKNTLQLRKRDRNIFHNINSFVNDLKIN